MSLFKKKKKEEISFEKTLPILKPKGGGGQSEIPSLPEEKVGFPSYDNELSSIKQEVEKTGPIPRLPMGKVGIPQRKPIVRGLQVAQIPQRVGPPRAGPRPMGPPASGKPVFIKIENYQDALAHMNNLRELIKQGEAVLSELTKIREEEDRQLNKWYHDIERVKEKLLSIDKKLFES